MSNFDKNRFASTKQDWTTPDDLWENLNEEFHFNFDLAASKENTKREKFFDEEQDGLKQSWQGICGWLNPPYSNKKSKLSDWVKKAYEESQSGNCTIVMLIPARTNTMWFANFCAKAAEVRFICGRPKFGGAKHGLPQPLAIIVFKKHSSPTIFSTIKI